MSTDYLYKVGIFTEDDNYAVCLAYQEFGGSKNTIELIAYHKEFSFNKILEYVNSLKGDYKLRESNFFINEVDQILIDKFEEKGIKPQTKEVKESTSITAIKSLLRDKELAFETSDLKEEIEASLKHNFNEAKSKHILKSIYLVCCEKIKLSGMELLGKIRENREIHSSSNPNRAMRSSWGFESYWK